MASDGSTAAISGAGAILSSQASDPTKFQPASGKTVPASGTTVPAAGKTVPASGNTAPASGNGAAEAAVSASAGNASPQVGNSVTPAAASASRVTSSTSNSQAPAAKSTAAKSTAASTDPQSLVDQINKYLNDSGRADQFRLDPNSNQYIQQVNPSSGAVVAEYAVSEFPALARSIGVSGLLIDDVA